MAGTSETTTQGVKVRVEPEYLPDHSNPAQNLWVHAYHVTITNESEQVLQLVWRQWIITNANGTEERVSGPGVVGQQPVLKPGERFEYTSWTRLATPQGTMRGSYFCMTEDAHWFESPVPEFMLAHRAELH